MKFLLALSLIFVSSISFADIITNIEVSSESVWINFLNLFDHCRWDENHGDWPNDEIPKDYPPNDDNGPYFPPNNEFPPEFPPNFPPDIPPDFTDHCKLPSPVPEPCTVLLSAIGVCFVWTMKKKTRA